MLSPVGGDSDNLYWGRRAILEAQEPRHESSTHRSDGRDNQVEPRRLDELLRLVGGPEHSVTTHS